MLRFTKSTEDAIRKITKPCPECGTGVMKNGDCNSGSQPVEPCAVWGRTLAVDLTPILIHAGERLWPKLAVG